MDLYGSNKEPNYLNKINERLGHDRKFFALSGRELRRLQDREQKKQNKRGLPKYKGFFVDGLNCL